MLFRSQPWSIDGLAALTPDMLLALAEPRPEVILLGTGARLQFPPPSFSRPLLQAGIGLETMDSVAACRTYNILMAEGRQVLLALVGREMSTRYNFASHMGVGLWLDNARRHALLLRVEHVSNARIKRPNPGENFLQVRYERAF